MRSAMQGADEWPTVVRTASLDDIRQAMASGSAADAADSLGRSAILLAAQAGRLDAVRLLIEAGADIDHQDSVRLNPLLLGCLTGNLELVRMMVDAGADINRHTRFDGTAIHPASEKGYADVVRYLAEHTDVNVNHTNICGWTPLLEAIILNDDGIGQQEIVRILLAAGADPTMTDQWGVSPLQHAERKGFTEIADLIRGAMN